MINKEFYQNENTDNNFNEKVFNINSWENNRNCYNNRDNQANQRNFNNQGNNNHQQNHDQGNYFEGKYCFYNTYEHKEINY